MQNIRIETEGAILWLKIGTESELHYSYQTICDLHTSIKMIEEKIKDEKLAHIVMLSSNSKVWNMGGDLEMFCNCIRTNNRELLRDYAYKCVESVHAISNGFFSEAVVTSVVSGNAFGGGFECALSGHYIIAEEQARFSFPEILFGTFPGMGAYSFLTRKVGYAKAKEMIESKDKWSGIELQKYGLVTHTCKQGTGIKTLMEKIAGNELERPDRFSSSCTTVPLKELKKIVDIWLDNVMSLNSSKIDFMMKIVDAQKNKVLKKQPESS